MSYRLKFAGVVLVAALGALSACGTGTQHVRDVPEGVSPALWTELNGELQSQLAARKTSAVTPITDPMFQVDDFALVDTDEENRLLTFQWSYDPIPGDYDLNGLVNASDLAPIGKFYEVTSDSPNWDKARLADGDNNGVITLGDITPVASNFNNGLHGYQFALEFQDYDGNGEVNARDLSPIGAHIMQPDLDSLGLGSGFNQDSTYPEGFGSIRESDAQLPDVYLGINRVLVRTNNTQLIDGRVVRTVGVRWIPRTGWPTSSVPSTYYTVVPFRNIEDPNFDYEVGQLSEQILVVHPE
jgi:hypothetical protein